MVNTKLHHVPVEAFTEVEGHRRVVVCFAVSDEVDLVLPLLLLQPVFGAAVVAHTAAAQNEDDCPHQPKPCSQKNQHRNVNRLKCAVPLIYFTHMVMNTLTQEKMCSAKKKHVSLYELVVL